jgi:hypothetical protein
VPPELALGLAREWIWPAGRSCLNDRVWRKADIGERPLFAKADIRKRQLPKLRPGSIPALVPKIACNPVLQRGIALHRIPASRQVVSLSVPIGMKLARMLPTPMFFA